MSAPFVEGVRHVVPWWATPACLPRVWRHVWRHGRAPTVFECGLWALDCVRTEWESLRPFTVELGSPVRVSDLPHIGARLDELEHAVEEERAQRLLYPSLDTPQRVQSHAKLHLALVALHGTPTPRGPLGATVGYCELYVRALQKLRVAIPDEAPARRKLLAHARARLLAERLDLDWGAP